MERQGRRNAQSQHPAAVNERRIAESCVSETSQQFLFKTQSSDYDTRVGIKNTGNLKAAHHERTLVETMTSLDRGKTFHTQSVVTEQKFTFASNTHVPRVLPPVEHLVIVPLIETTRNNSTNDYIIRT